MIATGVVPFAIDCFPRGGNNTGNMCPVPILISHILRRKALNRIIAPHNPVVPGCIFRNHLVGPSARINDGYTNALSCHTLPMQHVRIYQGREEGIAPSPLHKQAGRVRIVNTQPLLKGDCYQVIIREILGILSKGKLYIAAFTFQNLCYRFPDRYLSGSLYFPRIDNLTIDGHLF